MNLTDKSVDFDFQILTLSSAFYSTYPNPPYTEILDKHSRGYNCLLINIHYDYFICIPYRTNIGHQNAYLFKSSLRSQTNKSGLDYSKTIIIKNKSYINDTYTELNGRTLIDSDEYTETRLNIIKIKNAVLKYLNDYIAHVKQIRVLNARDYERRYRFTTLKYFHTELGITEPQDNQKSHCRPS